MSYYYIIYPTLCFMTAILGWAYSFAELPVLYEFIYYVSIIYFLLDGATVLYVGDYIYIIHHFLALLFLASRLWWGNDPEFFYIFFMAIVMEISNIFYNLRPTLKKNSSSYMINDALFLSSWVSTRIIYAIPRLWDFALNGAKVSFSEYFYPVAVGCLVLFTGLHAYWGFLIIKKAQRVIC